MSASALLGEQRTEPDLVLHNANILIVDAAQSRTGRGRGRTLFAVGSNDDVRGWRKPAFASRYRRENRCAGFIDAHTHPSYAGIRHLRWVDCDLRSIADIQQAIRERAAKTPAGTAHGSNTTTPRPRKGVS
jgi:predicted amidohydrolase YtcJ